MTPLAAPALLGAQLVGQLELGDSVHALDNPPNRVHGAEHLRAGESYVFLSTHQSWMDIPVMLGYLPSQLRIAAKREVFHIPFLGWHMRR